jgi:hypothetical protein
MNLYLDDDSVDPVLVQMLRRAGHDIVVPAVVGLEGERDAAHFIQAVGTDRVLLTGNHDDFKLLHELVVLTAGHHPGMLAVRKDNDRKRDMKRSEIVRALRNLIAAAVPLMDELIVLNHWR